MSTFYIDEAAGLDETGHGSQEQPYKSLAFAIFAATEIDGARYMIRKDSSAEYTEPTQSSLKKAIKGAEGLEKKRKKTEELAAREANEKQADKEKREKILEESKKVVLKEDSELPQAIKVCDLLFSCLIVSSALFPDKNRQCGASEI
jgi:asparaginyl-tRNA synthetase